ncbi:hypothetical protein Gotri_022197 [Gossypium trilobum]|uniref:Uncharacterized protein n=1 Tax=Gossypium trilobum TaxID=34281 RepID=A0A7J9DF72_9ROSI|nr:hypothetical protein [Gossypium trilobum]
MGDDTPNEGFGVSDEYSNENEGIPANEAPSSLYHETLNRRKQTLGVVHDKGKKSSSSRKLSRNTLTTQIEKLCESMASSKKSVNEIIFPHSQYTISNALNVLHPDVRVWWLQREYAEQNPIASFSSLIATSSFPFQLYHQSPPP